MLRSVYLKSLRDMRRAICWWSIGLIAMTALMISVYPTVRDNPDLNKLVENYPEALKAFIAFGGELDYTSGAGYLGSELFAFMVPLLLSIAAIGAGARATAGRGGHDRSPAGEPHLAPGAHLREDRGPATEIVLLALDLWISLLVGVEIVGMDVSAANLAAATAAAALLACHSRRRCPRGGDQWTAERGHRCPGRPRRCRVSGQLGSLVDFLESVRKASPYYHYVASDPLRHGLGLGHVAFLLSVGVLASGLAVLAFERRDLAA